MARYSDLIPDVRSEAPEAPSSVIESHARRAVIEFCRRSRFWRERLEIPLVEDERAYDLRIRPEGRCDQIMRARYVTDKSRRPLGHKQHGDIIVTDRPDRPGEPEYFSLDPAGQSIHLFPTPGGMSFKPADNPRIELRVVAVPTRRSRQFPDKLFEQWYEGLIAGTLASLLNVPSKPWTHAELAAARNHQFNQVITTARQAATADGWAPGRHNFRRWI